MSTCRICDGPLGGRAAWGHTGCRDCEILHLRKEIADGKTVWAKQYIAGYEQEQHEINRQASRAVQVGLAFTWDGDYEGD